MATSVSVTRTELCPGCEKLRLVGGHNCNCLPVVEARLMSTEETAYYLGTTVANVRRMVKAGLLRRLRSYGKDWKFDLRDVERCIAGLKEASL